MGAGGFVLRRWPPSATCNAAFCTFAVFWGESWRVVDVELFRPWTGDLTLGCENALKCILGDRDSARDMADGDRERSCRFVDHRLLLSSVSATELRGSM